MDMEIKQLGDQLQETHNEVEGFIKRNDKSMMKIEDRLADLEQKGADSTYLPGGTDSELVWKSLDSYLRTADESHLETKAWEAGSTDGSNAVPSVIYREMTEQVLQQGTVRQYARTLATGTGDFKVVVADDAQTGGWTSETGTRSVTPNAYLNSVTVPIAEQYAYVEMWNHFKDDNQFDLGRWVISEAFRQFRALEGTAFISGTGSDQPKGLAYSATSAVVDGSGVSPERPFGTFQHIASGTADSLGGDMLSSPQGDIMATLSNTVAALRGGYLPNSRWFMNPATKAALIQMRDLNGRPLVESGMMGNPDRILGYEISVDEFMPSIAANALPIAFGDMQAAYTIADHTAGLKVIIDEVTTKGKTGYYISRRVGGTPTDTNALKFIKCATS